jgi:hypothetical protein
MEFSPAEDFPIGTLLTSGVKPSDKIRVVWRRKLIASDGFESLHSRIEGRPFLPYNAASWPMQKKAARMTPAAFQMTVIRLPFN